MINSTIEPYNINCLLLNTNTNDQNPLDMLPCNQPMSGKLPTCSGLVSDTENYLDMSRFANKSATRPQQVGNKSAGSL